MIIEVSIIDEETYFDVQVWNVEEQQHEEDLESTFDTFQEASEYVDSLTKDKNYVVYHKDL